MKTIAFTLGCGLVALLTAGIVLLSAALLLNRSGKASLASTPTGIISIGSFTPAPIYVTPQPVSSLPSATPIVSLLAVPSVTPTPVAPTPTMLPTAAVALSTPTPSPVPPTPTASLSDGAMSQAETSDAATASGTTLPDRPPEAMGLLNRREGNTIFINAGLGSSSTVEVTIGADTVIYRDKTEMPQPGGSPPSSGLLPSPGERPSIQPDLELVNSLDEISGEAMILAWGKQQDNKVVAQILVYRLLERR